MTSVILLCWSKNLFHLKKIKLLKVLLLYLPLHEIFFLIMIIVKFEIRNDIILKYLIIIYYCKIDFTIRGGVILWSGVHLNLFGKELFCTCMIKVIFCLYIIDVKLPSTSSYVYFFRF